MSASALCLEIAGVRLSIISDIDPGWELPDDYTPFIASGWPPDVADLCVRLSRGAVREAGAGFRGGTWTLCRDGAARRIVWHADHPEAPRWMATFQPGNRAVEVVCAPTLRRPGSQERRRFHPFRYPMDQLILMYALAERRMAMVHAAGLVAGERGLVAAGRSGAGKSTLSRCWAARHGRVALLSDDRVIVCAPEGAGRGSVHGTPWPGELGVSANAFRSLDALVFLVQADENRLVPLLPREAVERLLPLISIPWFDPEYTALILGTIERWVATTPAYDLRFMPDEGAVDALMAMLDGAGTPV